MFEALRLAAIHRISTEGHWNVVADGELFHANPIDALILWHDGENISHSESVGVFKLQEIPSCVHHQHPRITELQERAREYEEYCKIHREQVSPLARQMSEFIQILMSIINGN